MSYLRNRLIPWSVKLLLTKERFYFEIYFAVLVHTLFVLPLGRHDVGIRL